MAQKFGIKANKSKNFSDWYSQVILNAELIDYHNIKGCYTTRSNAMYIWNSIKRYFTEEIEKLDVEEYYFPMLVTKSSFNIEKDHLESFDPELAWITKCGGKDLEEHIAIRPTSETIIYPAFSKWLKSFRELPFKINQWCNVLRWEVKSTLPFIRGREFLWQEGHTAFYEKNKVEAEEEVLTILKLYKKIYEDLLAVPVCSGKKSKLETFGGACYTLTLEAFIPGSGRGVQAATSHHLGQNFSKMFNIKVDDDVGSSIGTDVGRKGDKEGDKKEDKKGDNNIVSNNSSTSFVIQNCWGLTTRSIGIATMIHSDNKGFVCPPKVARIQCVIVPVGIKVDTSISEIKRLMNYVNSIALELKEAGIRIKVDDRENVTPGFKYNHWELRGVPLRIEIGFKELESNEISLAFRNSKNKNKVRKTSVGIVNFINESINKMHYELFESAKQERDSRLKNVQNMKEMLKELNKMNFVLAPWCNDSKCEEEIGVKTTVMENGVVLVQGAKTLCIPFEQNSKIKSLKCVNCLSDAKVEVLIGRSY